MEINVKDLQGSLGGGGRYDNLVACFFGEDVPACGFSLGLERIIVVMTEREMFPPQLVSSPADVMVSIWNEESVADSITLAEELRDAGFRVDLILKQTRLESNLNMPRHEESLLSSLSVMMNEPRRSCS